MRIGAHFKLYAVGLGILLLIGTMICTSCTGGGEPVPTDTQPPEVYITTEPFLPEHGDYITFIAAADDASGVDTIAIFVDGENVEQCHGSRTKTHLSCSDIQGPYNQGQTVQYWAFAVDCEGNNGESYSKSIIVGP